MNSLKLFILLTMLVPGTFFCMNNKFFCNDSNEFLANSLERSELNDGLVKFLIIGNLPFEQKALPSSKEKNFSDTNLSVQCSSQNQQNFDKQEFQNNYFGEIDIQKKISTTKVRNNLKKKTSTLSLKKTQGMTNINQYELYLKILEKQKNS